MRNKYPFTWVEASLSDVAYFQEGPGLRKFQFREEGVPFLNIQTLSNERVDKTKCKFLDPEEVESKYKHFLLETNDIICSSSGTLGKTAIVREEDKPLMLNTSVIRFRPHVQSLFSRGFLHIFLKSQNFLRQALNASSGSAQVNFGPTHLIKFTIPVPPLNEQHRIVAKIEELFSELDKGIENLKTARAQLKVYRQALLKHAFEGKLTAQWRAENQGKLETADALLKRIQQERAQRYQQQLAEWEKGKSPSIPLLQRGKSTSAATTPTVPPFEKGGLGGISGGTGGISKPKAPKPLPPLTAEELAELPELPEGWGWCKFSDVVNVESNLVSPTEYASSPHIAPDNIEKETGRLLAYRTVAEDEVMSPKHRFFTGQIIYSKIRPNLSKIVIARFDGLCSADMYPLSTELDTNYLFYLMLSKYFVSKASNSGSRTVLPKINQHELGNIPLPICSASEQTQIIGQLESSLSEIEQLELTLTTSLQQAEALRQSILKKAFSGQLVPQDPHDEPASELLARINAERAKSPQPPFAKGGRSRSGWKITDTEGGPI